MLFGAGLLGILELSLLVYCALSVLTTPRVQLRHAPRLAWLAFVVLLPLIGGVVWLLFGRDRTALPVAPRPPARPVAPDDDEDFLRSLRRRQEPPA